MHYETRSRWGAFASGVSVGLITGLAGIGMAVALERSRRRQGLQRLADMAGVSPYDVPPRSIGQRPGQPPVVYPPASASPPTSAGLPVSARQEAMLDEELAQTFPASDPLPSFRRVD